MTVVDERYRRFGVPARPIAVPRFRHAGLGADANEQVPSGDEQTIHELQSDAGGGGEWFGVRSFGTRFFRLLTPRPVGHGSAQAPPDTPSRGADPAEDLSPFDERYVDPLTRPRTDAGLGAVDMELTSRGVIDRVRERVTAPITGFVPIGPPRWSDSGPPPANKYSKRFTLRPEFAQDAQTFAGLRFSLRRGAHVSTSPVRMLPPRSNRLTVRELPSSYGQTTEVL